MGVFVNPFIPIVEVCRLSKNSQSPTPRSLFIDHGTTLGQRFPALILHELVLSTLIGRSSNLVLRLAALSGNKVIESP